MPTLPLALRDVLHQPVDGVVGVGRVIDRRRIQRPVQRPVHDVVALGAVFAAHVLHHADVAALDDHFVAIVVAAQQECRSPSKGPRCELSAWLVSSSASYGVRVSRIGARSAPFGTRMTVCSFTPSRIGIITSRRT